MVFPQPVWQYISILHFRDRCRDIPRPFTFEETLKRPLRYTPDPLLCGVYSTPFLARVLKSMPRLHTVSSYLRTCHVHGIPWSVIRLVLSLPALRDLAVDGQCIAPSLLPGEELVLDGPVPLTSFRYMLFDYRWWRAQTFPSEHQALRVILRNAHQTLERLTLITEIAPLDEISTLAWPNLQELCLRGEHMTIGDPPLPPIAMFAHMRRLRRLELKLAQPDDRGPQPFWPPSHTAEWPWPDLRHLTLSCPQVNDNVYAALPPTLESLSLRFTPHMMNAVWSHAWGQAPVGIRWAWPLLGSAGVLSVLRRCRCPRLTHLELEYREDAADEELLRYVGASFPALTSLKFLRYRPPEADTVASTLDPDPLLRMLGALPRLQTIHVHLDLPDTPRAGSVWLRYAGRVPRYDDAALGAFARTLQALADALARTQAGASGRGGALETIWLWSPLEAVGQPWTWEQFVVVREAGDSEHARVRAERVSRI